MMSQRGERVFAPDPASSSDDGRPGPSGKEEQPSSSNVSEEDLGVLMRLRATYGKDLSLEDLVKKLSEKNDNKVSSTACDERVGKPNPDPPCESKQTDCQAVTTSQEICNEEVPLNTRLEDAMVKLEKARVVGDIEPTQYVPLAELGALVPLNPELKALSPKPRRRTISSSSSHNSNVSTGTTGLGESGKSKVRRSKSRVEVSNNSEKLLRSPVEETASKTDFKNVKVPRTPTHETRDKIIIKTEKKTPKDGSTVKTDVQNSPAIDVPFAKDNSSISCSIKNTKKSGISKLSPKKKFKKQSKTEPVIESDHGTGVVQPSSPVHGTSVLSEPIQSKSSSKNEVSESSSSAVTSKPAHQETPEQSKPLNENNPLKASLKKGVSTKGDKDNQNKSPAKRKSSDSAKGSPTKKRALVSTEGRCSKSLLETPSDCVLSPAVSVGQTVSPAAGDSLETIPAQSNFVVKQCSVFLCRISDEECMKESKRLTVTKPGRNRHVTAMPKSRKQEKELRMREKAKAKSKSPVKITEDKFSFAIPSVPMNKGKLKNPMHHAEKSASGTKVANSKKKSKVSRFENLRGPSAKSSPCITKTSKSEGFSAPASSSPLLDSFTNFHKVKHVDPLDKLHMETEELDFEPGDDDDDSMSIYADSTMFQNETLWSKISEDVLIRKSSCDNDNDSVASIGSTDSRRLSDMDIDSDEEDCGNFKRNLIQSDDSPETDQHVLVPCVKENVLGVVVEHYAGRIVESRNTSSVESGELLNEEPSEEVELSKNEVKEDADKQNSCSTSDNVDASGKNCEADRLASLDQNKNGEVLGNAVSDIVDLNVQDMELDVQTSDSCPSEGHVSLFCSPPQEPRLDFTEDNSQVLPVVTPSLGTTFNSQNQLNQLPVGNSRSEKGESIKPPSSDTLRVDEVNVEKEPLHVESSNATRGALSLEVTAQILHKNLNSAAMGNVQEQEMEWEKEKGKVQMKLTPPHPGVHFDSPKRILPRSERGPLLPTPDMRRVAPLLPTPGGPITSVPLMTRPPKTVSVTPSLAINFQQGNLKDVECRNNLSVKAQAFQTVQETSVIPSKPAFQSYLGITHQVNETPPKIPAQIPSTQLVSPLLQLSETKRLQALPQSQHLEGNNVSVSPGRTKASKYKKDFDPYVTKVPHGDIDMRIQDNDFRTTHFEGFPLHLPSPGLKWLQGYCIEYLTGGDCQCTCNRFLLHKFPVLKCAEIKNREEFIDVITVMIQKLHYWRDNDFPRIAADIGNHNERNLLLKMAGLLWAQCCEGKTKLKQISKLWVNVVSGLCSCGLSPSKSVRQILHGVINNKKCSQEQFDAIDALIDAIYPEFIQNQTNLWEGLSVLAKLKSYEIPVHVLRDVLRDTMRNSRNKEDRRSLCQYLLLSPKITCPRKPEEEDLQHLIHQFISLLAKDGNKMASKLADYFEMNITNPCCTLLSSDSERTEPRTSKRFSLQRSYVCFGSAKSQTLATEKHGFQSGSSVQAACPTGRSNSMNRASGTSASSLLNARNPVDNMIHSPVVNVPISDTTREEEVSSSTEPLNSESLCAPNRESEEASTMKETTCAKTYTDVFKATLASQTVKRTFTPLKIVVNGSERGVTALESSLAPACSAPATVATQEPKKTGVRLRDQSISSVLLAKRYGTAASMVNKWRGLANITKGIEGLLTCLSGLPPEDRISSFANLLTGVQGYMGGSERDKEPKSVIITVGLNLVEGFMNANLYKEAGQVHDILWNKMPPSEVNLESYSHSYIKLLGAYVYFHNAKLKEALDIIIGNRFCSLMENWSLPWKESDVPFRDKVCVEICQSLKQVDSFVLHAEKMFREMLNAKHSYQIGIGAQLYDDILITLMEKAHYQTALALLVWAHNEHDLVPQRPVTNRLLLSYVMSLPENRRMQCTPQVLFILNQAPFREAVPESIEGLSRVVVYLQSVWHTCEIKCIVYFLLNCHVCNLPSGHEIPDIAVKIKESQLQEPVPSRLSVDPGVSAMQERVSQALSGLVNPEAQFENGSITLDPNLVRNYVVNRQSDVHHNGNNPNLQTPGPSFSRTPASTHMAISDSQFVNQASAGDEQFTPNTALWSQPQANYASFSQIPPSGASWFEEQTSYAGNVPLRENVPNEYGMTVFPPPQPMYYGQYGMDSGGFGNPIYQQTGVYRGATLGPPRRASLPPRRALTWTPGSRWSSGNRGGPRGSGRRYQQHH